MSKIANQYLVFNPYRLINPERGLLRLQVLDEANQHLVREKADFAAFKEWVAPLMMTSLGAAITGVAIYYNEMHTHFGLGLYASGLAIGTITSLKLAFHIMDIRYVERIIETVSRNV